MASLFSELYSDFQDDVKNYVQQLDITEIQFMRLYTRGMQILQREVNLVHFQGIVLPRDLNVNGFHEPDDCILIDEVRDEHGCELLRQAYRQYTRNGELRQTGFMETPTDFAMRYTRDVRLWSVYSRIIRIDPDRYVATAPAPADMSLTIKYVPDVSAFSQNSFLWNGFFPIPTNFMPSFTSTGVPASFGAYEDAFNNYAKSRYLKSKGSGNYKVFDDEFWREVERAKNNVPVYFAEGARDYMLAPRS